MIWPRPGRIPDWLPAAEFFGKAVISRQPGADAMLIGGGECLPARIGSLASTCRAGRAHFVSFGLAIKSTLLPASRNTSSTSSRFVSELAANTAEIALGDRGGIVRSLGVRRLEPGREQAA